MNRVLVIVCAVILSCVTQSSADITCHEGKNEKCTDADTCFTRFKLTTSFLGKHSAKYQDRGCKSTSDKHNQCNEDDYYCTYCNEPDCNNSKEKPNQISCVTCESVPECTKLPATPIVEEGFVCSTEWVKDGDKTLNIRSSITTKDDLNKCRRKEDETCKICSYAKCNDKIFPASRQTCDDEVCLKEDDTCTGIYEKGSNTANLKSTKCSSEISNECPVGGKLCKECENGKPCNDTEKFVFCIKCEEGDACTKDYAAIPPEQCLLGESCFVETSKEGRNTRGCTPSDKCPNEATVGENCHVCDTDECNKIIFPKTRKQCKDKDDNRLVCLNPSDECVGLYSSKGELTSSGCKEEISCTNNLCKPCKEVENTCAKTLPLRKCVQCDHVKDPSCTTSPKSLQAKTCLLNEKCFIENVDGKNTRGCTPSDKCPKGIDGENCHVCDTEDGCNKIIFPKTRKQCKDKDDNRLVCLNPSDECVGLYNTQGELTSSGCKEEISCTNNLCKPCKEVENTCAKTLPLRKCVQCDHVEDPFCTTSPKSLEAETCLLNEKCFIENVDGKNTRGCTPNDKCPKGIDGENCHVCDTEDGCNKIIFPKTRKQCKDKDDNRLVCLNPSDECVGLYSTEGELTSSGCKEEISCTNNLCKPCKEVENTCAKTLPLRKCVQCDHVEDPFCTTSPKSLEAETCQLDEKCFIENVDGKNTRGCTPSDKCPNGIDGENCDVCDTEDGCNKIIFPKTRKQCKDKDDNRLVCLNPSDECVGLYSSKGELTSSGCKEEISCTNNLCKPCKEVENTCAKTLPLRKCVQCDHVEDPFCTTSPKSLEAETCLLNEKCFIENVDGKNTRGCTPNDKCPKGIDGENCHVCDTEDGCNKIIFPKTRKQCQDKDDNRLVCLNPSDVCVGLYSTEGELTSSGCKEEISCTNNLCKPCKEVENTCAKTLPLRKCVQCDHVEDPFCTTSPKSLEAETCLLNEKCFIENVDGKNTRGCTPSDKCPNGIDGENCDVCDTEDGCNKIIFPKTRKQCKDKDDNRLVCLNPSDECVGLYSSKGELTSSGCKEEISCTNNLCKPCKEVENTCAKTLPLRKCVQCDHVEDPFCTTSPKSLEAETCLLNEKCFIENVDGKNTRGCTPSDKCPNGIDGENCDVCDTEDGCNKIIFPKTRKQCKDKDDSRLVCLNPSDVCVGLYSTQGNLTSSGCKEEISCTDNLCKLCTEGENACAKILPLRKCLQCDHVEDPFCTTSPKSLQAESCQLDEKCFVANDNGKNRRGCLPPNEVCDGPNCHACYEDSCNDITFPTSRQQCYFCNQGGYYCDTEINPNNNVLIELRTCIDVDDKCFTKITKDYISSRGCLKEVGNCDENCAACEGSKCNTQSAIKDAELSCYKCTMNDPGCGYMLLTQMVHPSYCRGKVLIGQEEKCYSFKNKTIERGCVLELDRSTTEYKECAEGITCNVCNTNNCNDKYINTSATITGLIYLVFGASYVIFIYNNYSSL